MIQYNKSTIHDSPQDHTLLIYMTRDPLEWSIFNMVYYSNVKNLGIKNVQGTIFLVNLGNKNIGL